MSRILDVKNVVHLGAQACDLEAGRYNASISRAVGVELCGGTGGGKKHLMHKLKP